MELLFESHPEVLGVSGKVYAVQAAPELHPEPVVNPDTFADGAGCSIYGTVLRDGGRLRMWYQAWPRDWDGRNSTLVAYAESDDGITWEKPDLGLVDYGPGGNHLCNLGLHAPSVFIDPDAPASHRYRATGWAAPDHPTVPPQVVRAGYYTAHSTDGLNWELDSPQPTWEGGDVISSVYHPAQRRAIVALKRMPRYCNVPRRSVFEAELRDGKWSRARCALVPDNFDDVCAQARGYASGDYYGMGMLPAGSGTVGFLSQFRHALPRTTGSEVGVFGALDVSLVYQAGRGDCWLHAAGRPDFLSAGALPWAGGGIYPSSCPVEFAGEHRLYFSGSFHTHGWYVDSNWQIQEHRKQQMIDAGFCRIGFARFPKYRLFGLKADPDGVVTLDLGRIAEPSELLVNYETESDGRLRVELEGIEGRSLEEAQPQGGGGIEQPAAWEAGTTIPPAPGRRVTARVHLDCATLYAYRLRPQT